MGERGRVAVCDHDPVTRGLVCQIGKSLGFDMIQAVNGREALATLIVGDVQIGFLDLALPELSAYEVAYRIRGMHLHQTPVLVAIINGASMHQAAVEFDAFLRKPIDPHSVAAILSGERLDQRSP